MQPKHAGKDSRGLNFKDTLAARCHNVQRAEDNLHQTTLTVADSH